MFTGIIENTGEVIRAETEGKNKHFWIKSDFLPELKIDQSIAHNGVCLTVVEISGDVYKTTAIDETLKKTNLNQLKPGDFVNLERCLKIDARLDGHIVQGHVDQTGTLKSIENFEGSWLLAFEYDENINGNITIPKGSICVNGISLTVVDSAENRFSVAVIPYTWEHTNLKNLNVGDSVNLEFDVIGKYIQRLMNKR
jgi:riboflavin synthase